MRFVLHIALTVGLLSAALLVNAKTYTRVGAKPTDWSGTYLIVYENTSTQAYVWNCEDAAGNYEKITQTTEGKITSDNLTGCEVVINKEGSNEYGIRVSSGENAGYIGTKAKSNGIKFGNAGAQAFLLEFSSPYVYVKTNSGTQQMFFYAKDNRFRIYYSDKKSWNSDYKRITLYKEGDEEVVDPENKLDLSYAQADFYACSSVFSGTYPYWDVDLTLAAADDEESVPMVWMQILAYSQYSIAGKYKATWTDGRAGYIHATKSCGQDCAGATLISKKGNEYGVAIWDANLEITAIHPAAKPNFYTYHIKMDFQDSNSKTWTMDKDIDVYGVWIDCDRSNPKSPQDMDPVAFALESGNHKTETEDKPQPSALEPVVSSPLPYTKYIRLGQLVIDYQGVLYNGLGQQLYE